MIGLSGVCDAQVTERVKTYNSIENKIISYKSEKHEFGKIPEKVRKEESSMTKHYIIMSSSYTDGTRIAFDITEEKQLNSVYIEKIISEIKQKCGDDVPLSVHFIETESDEWDSVREYDPFFEDVIRCETVWAFSEKISRDRTLSGLDVATYILSKRKCTHLSLEKLVYFAYADYLCNHSDRLFHDSIYAFRYGPVIDSVLQIYKKSGYEYLEPVNTETDRNCLRTDVKEMPAKSRILFAVNGAEKLRSIDETLSRYGKLTANQLVTLTHREGSPWSQVDHSRNFQVISDELIKAYHYAECI